MSSIIKSTDEHNKTILKAQAQAAEDIKRERHEQERRQRKVRAEEATAAERLRRNRSRKLTDEDESWDKRDGRAAGRNKVSRNWETWNGYDDDHGLDSLTHQSRKRRRSRSRDNVSSSKSKRSRDAEDEIRQRRRKRTTSEEPPPRRRRSSERNRDELDGHRRRHRNGTRRQVYHSQSPLDAESHKSTERRSPKYALDDLRDVSSPEPSRRSPLEIGANSDDRDLNLNLKDSQKEVKSVQGSLHESSASRRSLTPMTISRSRSRSPGTHPPEHVPSKMDRYFEESYDPRLDVEPLAVPRIPTTGLVSDADFEGWDAMLDLIRLRREDKVEKKRLERLGLLPTKNKVRKTISTSSSASVAERWNVEGVSVMDIEYSKKGTVREWDLGKEGL